MTKTKKKANVKTQSGLAIFLMIAVPIAIALSRLLTSDFAVLLNEQFSLYALPKPIGEHAEYIGEHAEYIIFVGLGALIVSFSKFVLGIKVWGVFRPVLLAVAFRMIGILEGIAFLVFVLSVNAFLARPLLKSRKTPYFARVSILLSSAVLLMLVPIFIGKWTNSTALLQIAMFPIIPLCLITESFAIKTRKEGFPIALSRTFSTVLVAVMITLLATTPVIRIFLSSPELLFAQIGLILLVARHLNIRLLENGLTKFSRRLKSGKEDEIESVAVIKI